MNTVYSYYDTNRLRHYVDHGDFMFRGAWNSATTYTTSGLQAVSYGSSLYIATTNGSNNFPLDGLPHWSPLVAVGAAQIGLLVFNGSFFQMSDQFNNPWNVSLVSYGGTVATLAFTPSP